MENFKMARFKLEKETTSVKGWNVIDTVRNIYVDWDLRKGKAQNKLNRWEAVYIVKDGLNELHNT